VLIFDAVGLCGLDPQTGEELWSFPWETYADMNSAQPLVLDNEMVLISSEAANGCALIRPVPPKGGGKTWTVEVVWQNKNLAAKFCNPVYHDGHIYGLSNGVLVCLDGATGERKWRHGKFGWGQLLLRGDQLLVVSDQGEVTLMDADPKGPKGRGKFMVFNDKTWNTPALAGKQLFLRNQSEMACLELP
jgi:outer membrane protein assembly factor BamB